MFKPLLLLIFAPPSPDGGTGRRARLKIWLSQGSAGSIPVLGTEARVSVSMSTNTSLWPFLHTHTQTHTVFLGCEGAKYPQTQTHAVFLGVKKENILTLTLKLTLFFVGLITNASLWPFPFPH